MALNRIQSIFNLNSNKKSPGLAIVETPSRDGDEEKLPGADRQLEPGELSFAEDTSGGLGRHLGLFSTTFLM